MEADYLEKHRYKIIALILAVLMLLGAIALSVEFGIMVGLKTFAAYSAVLFAICVASVVVLSFMLRKVVISFGAKVIMIMAILLIDVFAYVIELMKFIMPLAYEQSGIEVPIVIDPVFMLLTATSTGAIVMAVTWTVQKNKQDLLEKAGQTN